MELTLQKYGSYEKFEQATGGSLLSKTRIWSHVRKYMMKEGCLGEVRATGGRGLEEVWSRAGGAWERYGWSVGRAWLQCLHSRLVPSACSFLKVLFGQACFTDWIGFCHLSFVPRVIPVCVAYSIVLLNENY